MPGCCPKHCVQPSQSHDLTLVWSELRHDGVWDNREISGEKYRGFIHPSCCQRNMSTCFGLSNVVVWTRDTRDKSSDSKSALAEGIDMLPWLAGGRRRCWDAHVSHVRPEKRRVVRDLNCYLPAAIYKRLVLHPVTHCLNGALSFLEPSGRDSCYNLPGLPKDQNLPKFNQWFTKKIQISPKSTRSLQFFLPNMCKKWAEFSRMFQNSRIF